MNYRKRLLYPMAKAAPKEWQYSDYVGGNYIEVYYVVGDIVYYNGDYYEVIANHYSQSDYPPDTTPARYALTTYPATQIMGVLPPAKTRYKPAPLPKLTQVSSRDTYCFIVAISDGIDGQVQQPTCQRRSIPGNPIPGDYLLAQQPGLKMGVGSNLRDWQEGDPLDPQESFETGHDFMSATVSVEPFKISQYTRQYDIGSRGAQLPNSGDINWGAWRDAIGYPSESAYFEWNIHQRRLYPGYTPKTSGSLNTNYENTLKLESQFIPSGSDSTTWDANVPELRYRVRGLIEPPETVCWFGDPMYKFCDITGASGLMVFRWAPRPVPFDTHIVRAGQLWYRIANGAWRVYKALRSGVFSRNDYLNPEDATDLGELSEIYPAFNQLKPGTSNPVERFFSFRRSEFLSQPDIVELPRVTSAEPELSPIANNIRMFACGRLSNPMERGYFRWEKDHVSLVQLGSAIPITRTTPFKGICLKTHNIMYPPATVPYPNNPGVPLEDVDGAGAIINPGDIVWLKPEVVSNRYYSRAYVCIKQDYHFRAFYGAEEVRDKYYSLIPGDWASTKEYSAAGYPYCDLLDSYWGTTSLEGIANHVESIVS